ncbi:hypothetical protein H310_01679 [Aphanomyces invadans]|uniref:GCK domain-containing protein n=1 Tax=Aphanomyces invadans TaxID=157072 RepID=A0A024US25_9STRA|nr:hypothetical protein H310_01679 [Aphanomyces invadans]ETW09286.1 hypothetical protein H310_01679 [Aphanomyces invadans]|eukprot:XP_008863091.1 hypothetical protein H310_01679 [Aphanomyces invadans]
MASFFRRSLRQARHVGMGMAALTGGSAWSMTSSCETIPSSADPPHPATARRMEFVGVFLDAKSQDALKARFQALHGDTSAQSSLVLKYNPSKEELDAFAPIMGKNVTVKIQAVAQDEHAQAAIASVSTEHGDVNYAVECPHITVSVTGEDGYTHGYSNVLLERLQAAGHLSVDDSPDGLHVGLSTFEGPLPSFSSKLLPLYNPFPPTNASLTILADDALELTGVLCTSSTYDAATHSCGPPPKKAECGFCLFMKAGPCGEQFTTWEACLDQSKKEGSDFLTKCGPQTLALRDCVDANPEYYSVLNGDSNDDDEAPNDV